MEKIIKGDQVLIISGRDKGKKGEVIRVAVKQKALIVKGVNLVKKSVKKSKEKPSGGFIEVEAPIQISNAMVICPSCGKGVRVGMKIDDKGAKKRICKSCQHKFE